MEKFFKRKANVILLYDLSILIISLEMNAAERKKIEQSIALLQEVLGQKGGSGGRVSSVIIPGFDEEIKKFCAIADSQEP